MFIAWTNFLSAQKLSQNLYFQIFVHSDFESLYKHVPRRILPSEYGGESGTVESILNDWEKKLLSYRTYYEEEDSKYGVDEKKRTDQIQSFGVNGTFRQMAFD